ncbi:MAG: 2-oxo acid dehydrogenase subunit E2 [Anaerolineales bacterium]|nr:2-oxo acid dehydrogenase subunit E2 [Anaerolineales bacterium]
MAKQVIMPKFEMAQETGAVARWLKNEGDTVEKGEPLLEIETDKVTMEVEAPAAGILAGIKAGPGDVVPIGQVIAYLLKPGEVLPGESPAQSATVVAAPQPVASAAESQVKATPLAQRIAAAHHLNLQSVSPGASGERVRGADVTGYLGSQAVPPGKIRAVPAARRLARELQLDLQAVSGSGPGGRIQSADVRQAAAAAVQPSVPTPPPVEPQPAPVVSSAGQPALRRTVPLSSMRRTIAERLTSAARDIPQFTVSLEVEMSRAQQMVDDTRAAGSEGPRVTLTALLVKACAWVLARQPEVNASFNGDSILEWAEVNIGVAVAVEAGLIVPVIFGADRLSLADIAAQLNDLGARAREGKLRPEELRGGTFTISNLGMFGVETFTAIINPPQAAILAVGRTVKRAIVTEDEQIVVKPMASFTLTADHRVIDGAIAGRFLAALKQALERPGLLL